MGSTGSTTEWTRKRSERQALDIKPIRTKAEYRAALKHIESLMGAKADSPEGDHLDILAAIIEAYERAHFPMDLGARREFAEASDNKSESATREVALTRLDREAGQREHHQRLMCHRRTLYFTSPSSATGSGPSAAMCDATSWATRISASTKLWSTSR